MSAITRTDRWDVHWPINMPTNPVRYVRTQGRGRPTQHILSIRGDDFFAATYTTTMCGMALGLRPLVTVRPAECLRRCFACDAGLARARRAIDLYGLPEALA